MKPRVAQLTIMIGLSFAFAVGFAQAPPLEHMDVVLKSVPDGPVAHINGAAIPRGEFVQIYTLELLQLRQAAGDRPIDDRARVGIALRALSQLVNQEILYQEAKKAGLKVPAKDVEARWAAQLAQYQQNDPGLSEAAVLEKMGVTERDELLREIERMLLIDKMTERIVEQNGVSVSESELADLYNKNKDNLVRPDSLHIRQIYISGGKDPAARDAAKARAEHALARIQAGQRFEGIVEAFSQSPGAKKGGDMGPWPIDQFPPFLVEPALQLQPEQISGIIESEFGYHIIKLVATEKGSDLTFENAKPLLERTLRAKKGEEVILNYCDELVNGDTDILVYLELEKTLANDPNYQDLLVAAPTS